MPDWVWGVGLGFVALLLGGGFFLFTNLSGGGGGGCGKALPRLPGNVQVNAQGFQQEDDSMTLVIDYLNRSDLDNAFSNFYGDTHAFTHNIDPDIRGVNEEKAKSLCEAVLDIEGKLDPPPGTPRSPAAMATSATKLRDQLRDVAVALGYPRPE
ncbi:MAG: hypothetical protein Q7T33_07895 [Dehalococcoidia bacterium]|nr:hypothetical protein [Dehalococcoidia bacterium]